MWATSFGAELRLRPVGADEKTERASHAVFFSYVQRSRAPPKECRRGIPSEHYRRTSVVDIPSSTTLPTEKIFREVFSVKATA